ncbi:MAG: hypothetical protein EOP05_14070 [Proteobacteria bacterium]|nr:MAG: hypothetical protein EOP05_14070 [Pseudomonadota bacterium]
MHYSGNSCAWTELPPVSNSCEYQPAIPYVTPDLTAVQPDPPAPPDLSCQCNSRRIASGEFCMYCVQDADLGYGYADYTYGVSQCDSGNLKDIPNPGLYEPVATCGNTYGRARRIGDRFQQYSEIP